MYELEALFKGVASPTGSLHVDTSTMPWRLIDGDNNVLASATPEEPGCAQPEEAASQTMLAGVPLRWSGVPTPTDVSLTRVRWLGECTLVSTPRQK